MREIRFAPIARAAVGAAVTMSCLGFTACGGGSSTTKTSTEANQLEAAKEKGVGLINSGNSPAGANKSAPRSQEKISAKLKEQASKATPFLVVGADNSIPLYGSEGSRSQQREAQAALDGYLKGREAGKWGRACALMGASVRGQVRVLAEASGRKAPDCSAALALLAKYNLPRERKSVLVGSLAAFRVKGNRAFALFYGPHRQKFIMPMVREGGTWKVSQSIAIAYPIGSPARGG